MQPKRLSILGVGLLGGSLGLAAKTMLNVQRVVGYGHRPESLRAAIQRGAIDEAYDDPIAAVRGADCIVLCTPVQLLGELLERIAPSIPPQALVTDVGSTKRSIVAAAERCLPPDGRTARFVASHPMAGSEKRGVRFADATLFDGAVCILTPTPHTDPDALHRIEHFWQGVGMRTRRLSPESHDRLIGAVSHLPHALAAALVRMQDEDALPLAGRGFLDTTRIAAGDPLLWRDILLDNRDHLRSAIAHLRDQLDDLTTLLDANDSPAITAWLTAASERRQSLSNPNPDAPSSPHASLEPIDENHDQSG